MYPLTKEPENSLSVTLVLLAVSSFCLCAFNQCLCNPYHLLYSSQGEKKKRFYDGFFFSCNAV